ncbi:MAG: glycosyltransferase family 2 protein [Flavobacteriia bacterium]|jgi:glycosyltransferase involved in cell wall biosynthesis
MVSIVIPTVNREKLLIQTLVSVVQMDADFSSFEVLVIDNGSTDNTKLQVELFIEQNSSVKIRYVFEEIPGLLSARHRGLFEAKGDVLAYIDDDVVLSKNWLKSIIQVLHDKPEISILTGPCLPLYEENPPAWLDYFWTKDENGQHCGWLSLLDFGRIEKEINPMFVWGLNFIIRKKALIELKGFNPDNVPSYMQEFQGDGETGLALKAIKNNLLAFYHPGVLVQHVVPKARISKSYFSQRAFYQGVADSFTKERKNSLETTNPEAKLNFSFKSKIKSFLKIKVKNDLPHEVIDIRSVIEESRLQGFNFHQNQVLNNEKVKRWINKEDYLDYRLTV